MCEVVVAQHGAAEGQDVIVERAVGEPVRGTGADSGHEGRWVSAMRWGGWAAFDVRILERCGTRRLERVHRRRWGAVFVGTDDQASMRRRLWFR